tara:strand:+ start:1202 stop:2038 length:837 start_codon:yes stop_codon:yes gene_type:complete
MSNKNLLNESQVRQFMKLARLEPLTPGFVDGLTEKKLAHDSKAFQDISADEGGTHTAHQQGAASHEAAEEDERDEEHGRWGTRTEGNEAQETTEEDSLEELRTGKTGALGPKNGTANPGHGRGQGEAADGSLFEEEDLEAQDHDLEDAEHDMDHAEDLEDDAAEDLGDVGLDAAPAEESGAMVDVDQFLDILKSALESAVSEITGEPTEVEVADDVGEVEDEVEADVVDDGEMDVELSAEEEVELQEDETAAANNELVERITKRVAARILKSALAAKK